jgi:hypothetical protein
MVMQLGETNDPLDLVPGSAGSIAQVAGKMYGYSTVLTEAGNGLKRIDTTAGWSGAAGDAFRKRFHGEPQRWLDAGTCFQDAARALDRYIPALEWAQQQAGAAIEQWNQGAKNAAKSTLENARSQLAGAAASANTAVGQARDQAPSRPGFWSKVGHFFEGLGHDAEKAGATALDDLASVGNAAINHPLDDFGMVGGAMLAGVSGIGDGAGLALDATGVGVIVGGPLNVLSTAGLVFGGGAMMASAGDLASHAAGDDRVDPVNADSGSGGPPSSADPQYTPGTPEYQARIAELSKDPAHGGVPRPSSVREAQVGLQLEADGQVPGPITRAPLDAFGKDQGEFFDGAGQRWDVKSSPDFQPSYKADAGRPISNPQSAGGFTSMINKSLGIGENVMLDPDGMSPSRLAQLQQVVADHPEWQGKVVWGS